MRIFLLLPLLFFTSFSLQADLIVLKSGEEVEGTFLSETDYELQFEVNGQKKTYPKSKIKSLELGYTGSSFCYTLESKPDEEVCDAVLHRVDGEKMIIGKGKGALNKEEFSLKKVKIFSIKNVQKKDKLAAVLNKGISLNLKLSDKEMDVEINGTQPKEGKILYKTTGSQTAIQEIKDDQIKEIRWVRDSRTVTQKVLGVASLGIPGFYQFPRDESKGSAMIGLLLILGVVIPVEYSNAQNALNNDQDYLLYNNYLVKVSGLSSNPEFEKHKRNLNAAIGGLALLYVYHVFDVFTTMHDEKGNTTSIQLQWSPSLPDPHFIGARNTNIPNIGLKFSYSF